MATEDPPTDLLPVPGQVYLMWADYLVFGVILAVYIIIGLVQGLRANKNQTAKDFMTAQGQMPMLPAVLSLLASVSSAIIIIGGPAEIHTQGAKYWLQCFGHGLACVLTALLFVPLFYRLGLTSVYEVCSL